MSIVRYVTLDPTGNITCLVTKVEPGVDEKVITRRLMQECEQVAYLDPPECSGSRAKIRLMGGEFCGNAAMASACWLAAREGLCPGDEIIYPIEMSGMNGIMDCVVRYKTDGFEGTVSMPPVREILPVEDGQIRFTAVCLEGIAHLILDGPPFPSDEEAEQLLRRLAKDRPEEAVGLLQWDESAMYMRPLVLVKGSDTLVWETGCGSGSASVGAYRAYRSGGKTTTMVAQPGGVILVSADCQGGVPENITITGKVRFGQEKTLSL